MCSEQGFLMGLAVGLFVGTVIGICALSLCVMSRSVSEEEEGHE